jgi:RHS repeat-associated protein
MDQFAYHYKEDKPNQLKQVTDQVTANTNAQDLKAQPTDNYIYNNIGQLIANTSENIAYVYNTSGLVTEVHKDSQPRVKFFYNDKGFRVRKEAYSTTGVLDKTEYYVRDASGNTLAIYKGNAQTELPIYGAGNRLGVHYKETNKNVYQLADHLGNVRAVIARDPTTGDAMALTATDYYPFGMTMPGRQVAGGEKYRYAFQGQEKDEETGMEAFELRLWDSRIGRWLTTDPASQFSSPYLGMGNNPIIGIDPDGAWVKGAGFFRNIFQSDGRILANDFISSNGSGSLTRYKNLFVVDYNNASSNQAFNIYKRNGNFTGTLEVTGYQPTANGLEIQLGFDEIVRNESKFSDYRWVQSIRTDVPLGGATSPYNDPQPGDDNLPFYWTNAELPGYSNIGNNELTFYDKPGRRNNADWNAELSLVGKRNVKYRNLGTINYGFNLLNGRVSIKNIVFSTATKFHRKTFN